MQFLGNTNRSGLHCKIPTIYKRIVLHRVFMIKSQQILWWMYSFIYLLNSWVWLFLEIAKESYFDWLASMAKKCASGDAQRYNDCGFYKYMYVVKHLLYFALKFFFFLHLPLHNLLTFFYFRQFYLPYTDMFTGSVTFKLSPQ